MSDVVNSCFLKHSCISDIISDVLVIASICDKNLLFPNFIVKPLHVDIPNVFNLREFGTILYP
jgi:hypothetical protein